MSGPEFRQITNCDADRLRMMFASLDVERTYDADQLRMWLRGWVAGGGAGGPDIADQLRIGGGPELTAVGLINATPCS